MSMQKDHQPRNTASPKPSDRVCFRFHSRARKRAITEQHHNMLSIMVFAPFASSFTFFHAHCAEVCVCVCVWGAVVFSGYLFWTNKGFCVFHGRICKLLSSSVTRPTMCIYNKQTSKILHRCRDRVYTRVCSLCWLSGLPGKHQLDTAYAEHDTCHTAITSHVTHFHLKLTSAAININSKPS